MTFFRIPIPYGRRGLYVAIVGPWTIELWWLGAHWYRLDRP